MNIKIDVQNSGAITIPAKETNVLLRKRYVNTLLPYQRVLNMFKFTDLNSAGKFVRTRVSEGGVMWQPHTPCKKNPTGRVSFNSVSVTPCSLDFFFEMCSELWGTCFEHTDRFNADGSVDNAFMETILPQLVESLSNKSADELLSLMFLGQWFSAKGSQIDPMAVAGEDIAPMVTQEAACKGLLRFLLENIAPCDGVIDTDYTTCLTSAPILDMFERLLCCAAEKSTTFSAIVNMGWLPGELEVSPYIGVSANMYKQVRNAYNAKSTLQSPQFYPLDQVAYDNTKVYTYSGIPIIPVTPVNNWDAAYNEKTQFAFLTTTGNIEFGVNFSTTLLGNSDPVGFEIARKPGLENKNIVQVSTSALFDVNVVDPSLIVWDATSTAV